MNVPTWTMPGLIGINLVAWKPLSWRYVNCTVNRIYPQYAAAATLPPNPANYRFVPTSFSLYQQLKLWFNKDRGTQSTMPWTHHHSMFVACWFQQCWLFPARNFPQRFPCGVIARSKWQVRLQTSPNHVWASMEEPVSPVQMQNSLCNHTSMSKQLHT